MTSFSTNKLKSIMVFSFVLLLLLSSVTVDSIFFRFRYIVGLGLLVILLLEKSINLVLKKSVIVFWVFYLFIGAIPASIYNNNIDWKYLFVQMVYMIVAYTLLVSKISEVWFEIILWICHILFIVGFLTKSIDSFVFVNISTNYVSVIYVIFICIYAFICDKNKKKIKKKHILIAGILTICAGGRGGIICLTIMLIGLALDEKERIRVFAKSFISSIKTNLYFRIVFIVIVLLVLFIIVDYFEIIFSGFITRNFDSNGRFMFWKNYLIDCKENIGSMLFGANIKENMSQYFYNIKHLHNSYLTLYANIGIISTVYILGILFSQMKSIYKKGNKFLFYALLAFFVRAFTDIVFAGYMGEIVIYYLVWRKLDNIE